MTGSRGVFATMQHMTDPSHDFLQPFKQIVQIMEHGVYKTGPTRILVINDPAEVQAVMHSRSMLRSEAMRILAGDGLIFSDGEKWKNRRRSLQPSFPPSNPDHHRVEVDWAIEGLMSRLHAIAGTSQTFPILQELLRFTTRVIYRVAFGIELPVDHDLAPMLIRFFDAAAKTSMAFIDAQSSVDIRLMRDFPLARKELYREIDSIIEHGRRERVGEQHLLGVLLRMEAEEPEFTHEDIRDEIATMMLAGAETTSNVLTWLFLLLDAHPEQREVLESDLDDDPKAESLQSAILETMRLFPPVWFISRQAIEPTSIPGREFEPGDWAFICTYLVQRNPEYWDEPNRFRPDRFAPGYSLPHRYAMFPFGGGPHLCMGKALGELESFQAASAIMRSFRLVRCDDKPIPPRLGLVLKPFDDVPMRVEIRSPRS